MSSSVSLQTNKKLSHRGEVHLARSPLHQEQPDADINRPPPPPPPPGNRDQGISPEELQRSFKNHLTQPSTGKAASSAAQMHAVPESQCLSCGGSGGASGTDSSVFSLLFDGVKIFKVYMQHLGICLVTALVVLLACSLRGWFTYGKRQNKYLD